MDCPPGSECLTGDATLTACEDGFDCKIGSDKGGYFILWNKNYINCDINFKFVTFSD